METFLSYLGLAIGVVGLVTSYYFYKKSIRVKEPVYSIRSNNLISGSTSLLENLTVLYKDHRVENLTVSKILFYNRGAETINRQDIQTINPLIISSEAFSILDISVLQINNESNNIKVKFNAPNENALIDFDYLDKNQGVVIQVVHTGLSAGNLEIHGDIKGVERLTQVPPTNFVSNKGRTKSKGRTGCFLVSLLLTTVIAWFLSYVIPNAHSSADQRQFFLTWLAVVAISMLFNFLMGGGFVSTPFYGLFRYVVPEGLEKFLE